MAHKNLLCFILGMVGNDLNAYNAYTEVSKEKDKLHEKITKVYVTILQNIVPLLCWRNSIPELERRII